MIEDYGDNLDDNINAQLDMAVESADDIGDFNDEASEITEESTNAGTVSNASDDGGVVESGSGTESQAQPQTTQSQEPAPTDGTDVKGDGHGNLVDAAGNVVANRGAERRVYERSSRIQQENVSLQAEMTSLRQKQGQLDEFSSAPERFGMSREDAMVGMQLMNGLKTNPIETARNILQTAVAQGHSLEAIIGQVEGMPQSSVDMGAIKHMIDEKLAPITQRETQQREQQETQQRNQENAQQFFNTHEFSKIHIDAITNLMQNNQNMTPQQAYYEVKTYAMGQGYDFTQPLGPQVQARQQQGSQQVQQPVAPNQPMPNGNASSVVETQSPQVANGDDDWDSIVRQSMAESGMQL